MIKIAKFCIICQKPLIGKARKYCPDCKRSEHLEMMHKYYIDHTDRYQYNGIYWNNRKGIQLCGTGSLGAKSSLDWDIETEQIQKEMQLLNLRQKKKYWQA